jgi:putative PIN family toxin of toxin-antitoxin system
VGFPPPSVPVAVFDCQLFLQAALRGQGPAAACFDLVDSGYVGLVLSCAVEREVREVIARPKLVRKYPQLSSPRVAAFLAAVIEKAVLIDPVPHTFPYSRDPKDEPYLDLAIASGADYLVSRDQDLLDLRAPSSAPGQILRQWAPKLTILDPVELLRLFPALSQ